MYEQWIATEATETIDGYRDDLYDDCDWSPSINENKPPTMLCWLVPPFHGVHCWTRNHRDHALELSLIDKWSIYQGKFIHTRPFVYLITLSGFSLSTRQDLILCSRPAASSSGSPEGLRSRNFLTKDELDDDDWLMPINERMLQAVNPALTSTITPCLISASVTTYRQNVIINFTTSSWEGWGVLWWARLSWSSSDGLWYIMYFRSCGWRHVSCVLLSSKGKAQEPKLVHQLQPMFAHW